jgi:alpha-tubulin suppressor-like RCC1 family protein
LFDGIHVPADDSADSVTSRLVFRGEILYGESRSSDFERDRIFAYEIAGTAGDVVSISLDSTAPGTDPIVFLYGPRYATASCDHERPIAVHDDVDWPVDLGAEIAMLRLPDDGMYLVAVADKALSAGDYTLTVRCGAGECNPELVCGGLSNRGCPSGYGCARGLECATYSGVCEPGCVDADGDGFGTGCGEPDCDDTRAECTTDCSDRDGNGIPDCADRPHGSRISAGWDRTVAIQHRNGELMQWGWYPLNGFPDYGRTPEISGSPLRVPLRPSNQADVVAEGKLMSCAVVHAQLWCWGNGGTDGQLGLGGIREDRNRWYEPIVSSGAGRVRAVEITAVDRFHDYEVVDLEGVVEVTLGEEFGCTRVRSGRVLCWGADDVGQRGASLPGVSYRDRYEYGERIESHGWGYAAMVTDLADVIQIDAGNDHACALHGDGTVSCWGDNRSGQLGDGTDYNLSVRAKRVVGIRDAVHISAGQDSSCAVHTDGRVSCWGRVHSSIDFGTIRAHRTPTEVLGLSEPIVRVAVGWDTHTCGVGESGAVYCWGTGILGTGVASVQTSSFPMRVLGIDSAVDVTVGVSHACVELRSGNFECWGGNGRGQIGDGSAGHTESRYQPVPVRDPG